MFEVGLATQGVLNSVEGVDVLVAELCSCKKILG